MIITCSILFWGIFGFFVPKKHMRGYFLLAAIGISSLYFFFLPPVKYDLYRYYETERILRNSNIFEVLSGSFNRNNEILRDTYLSAPLFLLYTYLIGLLQVDQLLVVITGVIIYASTSSIILMAAEDIGEDIANWKIAFCFFFLLVMLDFRSISALRYTMGCALFAHVAYRDMVRNANKLLCFMAYISLAFLHNSVWILIAVRVMVELSRFIPRQVFIAVCLAAYSFFEIILGFLKRYSSIPMVKGLIIKMEAYGFGGGTSYARVLSKGVIRFCFLVFYLILYHYCIRNIPKAKKFHKFGDMLLLFSMFTLGAITQSDLFLRGNIFLYYSVLPFLLLFLHYVVGDSPLWLNLPDSSGIGFSETVIYLMVYMVMATALIMYYTDYYTPMDPGMLMGIGQFLS